jgi:hypothetical protein
MYAHQELSLYGIRRLKRIARFIQNRVIYEDLRSGFRAMFGEGGFRLEFNILTPKAVLVGRICQSGVFEFIATKYHFRWETLIQDLTSRSEIMFAYCGLLGLETEIERRRLLQRISNKLSVIFHFPGDPIDVRSRKQNNDLRLNLLLGGPIFGQEPLAVAQSVSNFSDTITNPLIRRIFWNSYVPGTGQFSISVANLDKLVDEENNCPICLENFHADHTGLILQPCGHGIHFPCVKNLLLSSGNRTTLCPLCRAEITNLTLSEND